MVRVPEFIKRPVRALESRLEARRREQRLRDLASSAPVVTRDDLVAGLRGLGIDAGDVVFVHSSLKSLGYVEGGAGAVVEALCQAVEPGGTILMPAYWQPGGTIAATCELPDYHFDLRVHGTNMGALPAALLARPGVQRSLHPTHSVAAWGRLAREMTEAHHLARSVFGEGSPWQRFADADRAKVLGLGISMGPVTFYHRLEDMVGDAFPLPIWSDKAYSVRCVGLDGSEVRVPVRAFKPEYMPRRIDHPSRDDLRAFFARDFERQGIKRNGMVAQAHSWVVPAQAFLQRLQALLSQGITIYSQGADLTDAVGER